LINRNKSQNPITISCELQPNDNKRLIYNTNKPIQETYRTSSILEVPLAFIRRLFSSTLFQQFIKQRNYEAKYNIDLVQDPNTGKTTFVDRPKDEVFKGPNNT